jgi:beta-lactamase class C
MDMIYHLPFRDWLELNKSPAESIAASEDDPDAGNGDSAGR